MGLEGDAPLLRLARDGGAPGRLRRGCRQLRGGRSSLALEGEYRIATPRGEVVCRPAFELYAALCRSYPPEAVEATCWIPRDQLEAAARLIWHARPVSYYAWSGHEQHANTTQTARAMSLLYALTGSFDAPGGNVLLPAVPTAPIVGQRPAGGEGHGAGARPGGTSAGTGALESRRRTRALRAMLEGKPYPVRGLIGFGANMLMSQADGITGARPWRRWTSTPTLDLFMTPTAALADVVLPVASAFEREALRVGFEISAEAQSLVQLRPGRRAAARAGAAGCPHHLRSRRPPRPRGRVLERRHRRGLSPATGTLGRDAGAVARPSARGARAVEDAACQACAGGRCGRAARLRDAVATGSSSTRRPCSSTATRRCPISSTPRPRPRRLPDPTARFPLLLTCAKPTLFLPDARTGRSRACASARCFPRWRYIPRRRGTAGYPTGDWVSITTPQGSVRACARFNETLDPRVVVGQHGWWQGCAELDAPGYDPFGPTRRQLQSADRRHCRATRSAAPHPTAPTCARSGQSASRDYEYTP